MVHRPCDCGIAHFGVRRTPLISLGLGFRLVLQHRAQWPSGSACRGDSARGDSSPGDGGACGAIASSERRGNRSPVTTTSGRAGVPPPSHQPSATSSLPSCTESRNWVVPLPADCSMRPSSSVLLFSTGMSGSACLGRPSSPKPVQAPYHAELEASRGDITNPSQKRHATLTLQVSKPAEATGYSKGISRTQD